VIDALRKQKPAPLLHPDLASLIEPCSFGSDSARYGECDWIVEAVTERLDIKRRVFDGVRLHARPTAVVTSNTSGIPIASMVEGTSSAWRRRFFVTHFFNPVRYMHLLELVAGPDTDRALFDAFAAFGQKQLGKGIVVGRDTPNFVANRIGTFGLLSTLHKMGKYGMGVAEVDKIFGKPLGRPKSAVFRTADLVGLDTLAHVAKNCLENLPHDPWRDVFRAPPFIDGMLAKHLLGDKSGGGFYRKHRGEAGKEILQLDLATLEYGPQPKVRFESLGAVKDIEEVGQRVKAFLAQTDAAARFAWEITADVLVYSAGLVGEIADDVANIDAAMRWGFGWEQGPFETWDALGVAESVARMRAEGRVIPAAAELAEQAGGWYSRERGVTRFLDVAGSRERRPLPRPPGAVVLADRKEGGHVVARNLGATIIDLGDGVACLEFHTKMNALDGDIIGLYAEALDRLDTSFDALVVANQGAHFSAGANIMMVLMASMSGEWAQIETMTRGLQDTVMRAKYHRKPVVTAPHGMTLGGGLEVALHSAHTRASRELYAGLVEVGVGLLPSGGGTKEMAFRMFGSVPAGVQIETSAFSQRAFELIGMAKVSTSAEEARDMGFLRATDTVSMNGDLLVAEAKEIALGLARAGHRPPRPRRVRVPGRAGSAQLAAGIWGFQQQGLISAHDAKIGLKIAHVLCGGDVPAGTEVDEQRLLDLEREAFVSLCGEPKTQERIQHMLMNGKPLRN
jgi:3-hydroxyacyl-CoA dehydrogenase